MDPRLKGPEELEQMAALARIRWAEDHADERITAVSESTLGAQDRDALLADVRGTRAWLRASDRQVAALSTTIAELQTENRVLRALVGGRPV